MRSTLTMSRGSARRYSLPDYTTLTPATDTPVITYGTSAPTGTTGVLREKRTGVAETAAGGTQTSNAALDQTGSTRFRYPGQPDAVVDVSGAYVTPSFKPGSDGANQAARWFLQAETDSTSAVVHLRGRTAIVNPTLGLWFVNNRRVAATPVYATLGTGGYFDTLTFPGDSVVPRNIKLIVADQGHQFGGAYIPTAYSIAKPTTLRTRRIVVIGDSYVNGSSTSAASPAGAMGLETFIWPVVLGMGADEIVPAGIGGTGWVVENALGTPSRFQGRIAAVMALNPHVVIFAGGRNDSSATGVQTAVELALDTVGSNVERYVTHTCNNTGQSAVIAAMAAGCKSRGVPFIDTDINGLAKLPDGIHPTYAGHQTLAANLLAGIRSVGA